MAMLALEDFLAIVITIFATFLVDYAGLKTGSWVVAPCHIRELGIINIRRTGLGKRINGVVLQAAHEVATDDVRVAGATWSTQLWRINLIIIMCTVNES